MSDSDMNEPGTMSIRESAETGRMRRSSNAKLLVARAPVINARLLDATMVTGETMRRSMVSTSRTRSEGVDLDDLAQELRFVAVPPGGPDAPG